MQLLVLQALTYTSLSLLIGVLYSVVSISTDSQRKVSATSLREASLKTKRYFIDENLCRALGCIFHYDFKILILITH